MNAIDAFEEALNHAVRVGDQAESTQQILYAFCDQDDIWHAVRLAQGIEVLGKCDADLALRDAALINASNTVLHQSMIAFKRRHKRPGLRGLLYRNNITGITSLITHRLAKCSLPFPTQIGNHFYHYLLLALLAGAISEIRFIDAPLVDYRQHSQRGVQIEENRFSAELAL